MSESIFFPLPCTQKIGLRLDKEKLTFYSEYSGRSVLTSKAVAQIGFDLCESAQGMCGKIEEGFREMSGITLSDEIISRSKYSPVEARVFGIVNENTAVYSLGVLLRDMMISTGRGDSRLRAILDKTCAPYPFMRYDSFCQLRDDLALYLKTEIDESTYGVMITCDTPLPSPVFTHSHKNKDRNEIEESACFTPYSRAEKIRHKISKHLTFKKVQVFLTVLFLLFSSVSVPLTRANKSMMMYDDIPTMTYYINQ